MKILPFSSKTGSGYTCMKSAILDFSVEYSVITFFLYWWFVISVLFPRFYLFRGVCCSTELLSEETEATLLSDDENKKKIHVLFVPLKI
jgi:hypothetical protein